MIIIKCILIHLCIVYIIDMSGFVEEAKKAIGLYGKNVKPFDCSKCLSFWVIGLYLFWHLGVNLIYSVSIGALFATLPEISQKTIEYVLARAEIWIDNLSEKL